MICYTVAPTAYKEGKEKNNRVGTAFQSPKKVKTLRTTGGKMLKIKTEIKSSWEDLIEQSTLYLMKTATNINHLSVN